jgi:hypothetical protein
MSAAAYTKVVVVALSLMALTVANPDVRRFGPDARHR